jgi:AAA domain
MVQAIRSCCPVVGGDTRAADNGVPFHLIQGPPGTGKTHLICGIVSCWLHGNEATSPDGRVHSSSRAMKYKKKKLSEIKTRVLVCAQSNAGMHACMHACVSMSSCLGSCMLFSTSCMSLEKEDSARNTKKNEHDKN